MSQQPDRAGEVFPDDTGCEAAPKCLECPLETCIEDLTDSKYSLTHYLRDIAIYEGSQQGMTNPELQTAFGMSERHIHRVIQRKGPSVQAKAINEGFEGDKPVRNLADMPARYKARQPWPQLMRRVS